MKLPTIPLILSALAYETFAAPTKLSTPLSLKLATSPWSSLASQLNSALPTISVSKVLAAVDHAGSAVTPASPLIKDLRFSSADGTTTGWYPQGVTTSADSLDSGKVDGVEVLLTSWYDHTTGGPKGVRIGFTNPTTGKYVYALLVVPKSISSGTSYDALKGVHAGGIMWYGNHLYVVDTWFGLRIFDMNKILQVTAGSGIGLNGGKYYAHGYKYIIPQIGTYTPTSGSTKFRFSYISLDRTSTPDSILVGEYESPATTARIARFDINYQTRLLSTGTRRDMWKIGKTSIQGGVVVNGRFYFTKSHGEGGKSELLVWNGKASGEVVSKGAILPNGAEDLSYWKSKDALYSVGEHPGKRKVFAVKASRY